LTCSVASLQKKDYGFPKQPESSYLAFRTAYQRPIREELARVSPEGQSISMKAVADAIAARWKTLSAEDRAAWSNRGQENKRDYERKVAEWKVANPGMTDVVPEKDVDAWAAVGQGGEAGKWEEEEFGEVWGMAGDGGFATPVGLSEAGRELASVR
jgi:acyl-CoA reductase-like NAD-dependent aldehyde dehydrogenase